MERLTTNKPVDEMSMLELAYNSCYAKNGNARYRDFEMDMDARDFARNLMVTLTGEELPIDDEAFDEEMHDNLQYDQFSDVKGLIALFYRNLWAMADLRETLKAYEDKQEQGLLIELPRIGDTVYLRACCECVCISEERETGLKECPFENDCDFDECENGNERMFKTFVTNIWNDGHGWYFIVRGLDIEIPVSDIGRTVFFTEEALAKMGE